MNFDNSHLFDGKYLFYCYLQMFENHSERDSVTEYALAVNITILDVVKN